MQPLADKIRPTDLQELAGQEHLLGKNGILTNIFSTGNIPSLIFWGPAGCGKTTIAKMIMRLNPLLHSECLSATNSGAEDLRKVFAKASKLKEMGQGMILMIDEIHCFRRNQQDLFLPYIEDGTIILLGATTENPSFELNSALLSRCRVVVLKRLNEDALKTILVRVETSEKRRLPLTDEARESLIAIADGDARYLINSCEELLTLLPQDATEQLTTESMLQLLQKHNPVYDKKQDAHYSLISALHKSLRGSDVNAALYWMARMMVGGEHPHYILRRLIRFAVEDIGMADPQAVLQALAAKEAYDFLGSPEGDLAVTQAVVYLATAPKSNAQYVAHNTVFHEVEHGKSYPPPKRIINAPTKLMNELGFGEGYIYDHDTPNCFSGQNYFPDEMQRVNYYHPNPRGFEREIQKRLEYWQGLREKLAKPTKK